MQIHNAVITGSFAYNGVDISSVTSSTSNITSLNAITASILSTTASLNTASGSAITRLNAIEAVTGSYATTGSNTFVGNQTITGSILGSGSLSINGYIVSTGQIVAQTINVQQVTSSIVYSCGSNIFGCAVTDTQQMTGSVRVTGSLGVIGTICSTGNNCFGGSVVTYGCLGVNTNGPQKLIHVANNTENGIYISCNSAELVIGNSHTFASKTCSTTIALAGGNTDFFPTSIAGDSIIATQCGNLLFGTGMNAGVASGTERMRISNAGNVGVGTIDPTDKLYVIGADNGVTICSLNVNRPVLTLVSGATSRLKLSANTIYGAIGDSVSNDRYMVFCNGCVGIATTTPGFTLDVNGVLNVCTSTGSQVRILNYGGSSSKIRNTQGALVFESTGDMAFETNGVNEKARITAAGIACFACQVCAPTYAAIGVSRFFGVLDTSSTVYRYMEIANCGGSMYYGVERSTAAGLIYNSDAYSTVWATTNATNLNFGTNLYKRFTIDCTGVSTFTCQLIITNNVCINGSGYGLQFTGGNNRIYFGACRAIEGSTSGTVLQLGEHYTCTFLQSNQIILTSGAGGASNPRLINYSGGNGNANGLGLDMGGCSYEYSNFFGYGTSDNGRMTFGSLINNSYSQKMIILGNGNIGVPGNATAIYNASDCRLKENVNAINDGIGKIMCLNPVSFNWKESFIGSEQHCRTNLGFLAQEVQTAIPEAVEAFGGSDIHLEEGTVCNPLRVNEKFLLAVAVKAIQEQQCTINALKTCLGII